MWVTRYRNFYIFGCLFLYPLLLIIMRVTHKAFSCMLSFNLHISSLRYPHFTDEETETKLVKWLVQSHLTSQCLEPGFKPRQVVLWTTSSQPLGHTATSARAEMLALHKTVCSCTEPMGSVRAELIFNNTSYKGLSNNCSCCRIWSYKDCLK